MKVICVLCTLLYVNSALNKTGRCKFVGWWGVGVVRFENSVCTAANGLLGICYTRRQCTTIGGYVSGKCARNIGVCCVVQVSCGATSSNNNTYFQNPSFPNIFTGANTCSLTVQRCSEDICQIRIDFLSFSLAQPNGDGVCANDALIISGGAANLGRICGDNTGQHIYLDFNNGSNIDINIFTSSAITAGRQWNLRVAQIGCDSPSRAMSGCLMYYRGTSGTVRSFNYGQSVAIGGRQLANMNYGVCIRTAPGMCSIQWSATSGDSFAFTVSLDAQVPTALTGNNCETDYVIIPNGVTTTADGAALSADRYCGSMFTPVTSSSTPFVLYTVTNGNEATDSANRGFSLSYTQQQCTNNLLQL
ncbi:hypothetical protein RI129_011295 [Pyrocoelia pectoralis]|uniref:CUB domain-containing protein n=1 Tax=Pyrocoelia pectoralis TaxID=417401 RepID=A0AAN7VAW6_9COLE